MLFVVLAYTTSCTEETSTRNIQILTGADIIDGTGKAIIEHGVILIRDGRIECVGEEGDCPNPAGADIIDVTGKYITPGLIDGHVHFFQTGFFDSRPDAMDITDTYPYSEVAAYQKQHPERYYNSYLCSGITGVYDVGGMSWSVDFQESAEQNPNAPHVAAAGPLITPVSGAPFDLPSDKVLVPLESAEAGIKTVQYLSALGSTGIKLWQLDADNDEYMDRVRAVAEETERQDNKLIVHATTLEQATAAVEAGAKLLVHSVSDVAVDQNFLDLAKQQGTYYNPTLIVSSGYMMAYRAAAGIEPLPVDDPNSCVDSKTLELVNNSSQFEDHSRFSDAFLERIQDFDIETDRVSEVAMQNLLRVYEAGIPIIVGTDAGNPGTLHGPSIYEEMEFMQEAGIPAEDLIVMATRNGAEAMERGNDFGTLEAGKLANLIILDDDPSEDISKMRSITHTMIKGVLKKVVEIPK
ncbi:amidohydrolase family protein [Halalkalibaculum roseum]|nr:amidohydrolase family protein [Halalkalibaculum roseum]